MRFDESSVPSINRAIDFLRDHVDINFLKLFSSEAPSSATSD